MKDSVKFRVPGSEVLKYSGVFQKTDHCDGGFFLSPWNGDLFVLKEGEIKTEFESNAPHCIDQASYLQQAETFRNQIINRGLQKAIYSRVKKVDSVKSPDHVFNQLVNEYPEAFVYLIRSHEHGTWLGASPEILLKAEGNKAETMSLAGTIAGDQDWSSKEEEEQSYVSEFIGPMLKEQGATELIEHPTIEFQAGPVRHLLNRFEFNLDSNKQMTLLKSLHPTPAVCGLPKEESLKLINEIESHDRELYTGYLGVKSDRLDAYVNLRCAKYFGGKYYLFLGSGFTRDSSPNAEWIETENKALTLINVLK